MKIIANNIESGTSWLNAVEKFSKQKGVKINTFTYAGEVPEDNTHRSNENIPFLPFTLKGLDADYRVSQNKDETFFIWTEGN
jgi:hypothetical protein